MLMGTSEVSVGHHFHYARGTAEAKLYTHKKQM